MPRITLIGAGSTVFAKRLIGDILLTPELRGEVEVMLHNIDTDRLNTSEIVTRRLAKSLNLDISIQASTDRRAMLQGVDYVILMMQVGGYRLATVTDFEIPKKYGLRQTIADTLGVGRRNSTCWKTIPRFTRSPRCSSIFLTALSLLFLQFWLR